MSKKSENTTTPQGKRPAWGGFAVAAALVLAVGWGIAVYQHQQEKQSLLVPNEIITGVANPQFNPAKTWQNLDAALSDYTFNSAISSEALAVYANLEGYTQFTADAFKQAPGLEIDYIGDAHLELGVSEDDPELLASQSKTRKILKYLGQEVTGIEGAYCGPITRDCLTKEVVERTQEINPALSAKQIMDNFQQYVIPQDAGADFVWNNQGMLTVGLDVKALHHLHYKVITLAKQFQIQYFTLNDAISQARTDMAMARMINFMWQNHKTRGVVSMGYNHVWRLKELAMQLGLTCRIYNTTQTAR